MQSNSLTVPLNLNNSVSQIKQVPVPAHRQCQLSFMILDICLQLDPFGKAFGKKERYKMTRNQPESNRKMIHHLLSIKLSVIAWELLILKLYFKITLSDQ